MGDEDEAAEGIAPDDGAEALAEESIEPPDDDAEATLYEDVEETDGASHGIARVESHDLVVGGGGPGSPTASIQRIGAWLDSLPARQALDAREQVDALPDATERLAAAAALTERPSRGEEEQRDWDANQFDVWANRVLDVGLTDIVLPINTTKDPPFTLSTYLSPDDWRRLRFMMQRFDAHASRPRVHVLAFVNLARNFIEACGAALIDLCTHAPSIASVMLDAEEWWVGSADIHVTRAQRRAGARAVRTHLLDPWPAAQRPTMGIGVTGIGSSPPSELLEMIDFGIPQIYGSSRNMGGEAFASARREEKLAMAAERHRLYYRRWVEAFGGATARVVVGHTARPLYIPDVDRLRLMVEAALGIEGAGSPALAAPDGLYYWSMRQIFSDDARTAEVRRLTDLARAGGVTTSNVNP